MTRARGLMALRVEGHTAVRSVIGIGANPAPHDAAGTLLAQDGGDGHAKCSCRELSGESLPSGAARRRWHTRHKEETAGVPWSDAALSERYS